MNANTYRTVKGITEVPYKNRKEISTLITIQGDDVQAETLATYKTLDEALAAISGEDFKPYARNYGSYIYIEEYYVEIYEADEDGEFFEGSDFETAFDYHWDDDAENIIVTPTL